MEGEGKGMIMDGISGMGNGGKGYEGWKVRGGCGGEIFGMTRGMEGEDLL